MAKDRKLLLSHALSLLDSDARGMFVDELSEKVGEALDKARGNTAVVHSAVDLTEEEQMRIENLLKSILKRELQVSFHIKKELLGGFLITVGDWKLDATLASQLAFLKESLE
jgi:F-type H+-transporting ATPase subunit delta